MKKLILPSVMVLFFFGQVHADDVSKQRKITELMQTRWLIDTLQYPINTTGVSSPAGDDC